MILYSFRWGRVAANKETTEPKASSSNVEVIYALRVVTMTWFILHTTNMFRVSR